MFFFFYYVWKNQTNVVSSCCSLLISKARSMLAQASATRASGQTEKKKRKTEWAGLGILSGPCRTIELQQRHCQHSGPLTANTYSFLRMTSLAADIVTHWKNTERDHRAVSSVSKRKKKKSQFPWQQFSSNSPVISVTEDDISWLSLLFSFFTAFLLPGFALTHLLPTELSSVIMAPHISSFLYSPTFIAFDTRIWLRLGRPGQKHNWWDLNAFALEVKCLFLRMPSGVLFNARIKTVGLEGVKWGRV